MTPSDLMHLTLILPPIEISNLKSRLLDKDLKDTVKDPSLRKLTLIGATLHLGFQIKSIWKWPYNTQSRKVTRRWMCSSMKTLWRVLDRWIREEVDKIWIQLNTWYRRLREMSQIVTFKAKLPSATASVRPQVRDILNTSLLTDPLHTDQKWKSHLPIKTMMRSKSS